MKKLSDISQIVEKRGDPIDEQWINDEKPVMTADGRQVIVTKVDIEQVPNIIVGKVKMKDGKLQEYEWTETGICTKAIDNFGNPKRPESGDKLVKSI